MSEVSNWSGVGPETSVCDSDSCGVGDSSGDM